MNKCKVKPCNNEADVGCKGYCESCFEFYEDLRIKNEEIESEDHFVEEKEEW